jgi:hypothetical protein
MGGGVVDDDESRPPTAPLFEALAGQGVGMDFQIEHACDDHHCLTASANAQPLA